jgi:tetratricopeptide (TPR) repeat protein
MNPSSVDAVLDIGETYVQLQNYDLAEKYLKKSIRMDPEYFSPYNEMGNLCLIRKDYNQAIQYYQKSLRKKSDYTDALIGLGKSYAALKKYDTAEEYLNKAIKTNEDHCGEALSTMGDIKTAQKDYKEAEKYYKKAIETDEYDAHGYLGLGKLYLITKKTGKAEKVFHQSLKINPRTAFSEEIHYNLALIYAGKKKNELALKHLELSLKSNSIFLDRVKNNPSFKLLREMPQYKKLIKKIRNQILQNP